MQLVLVVATKTHGVVGKPDLKKEVLLSMAFICTTPKSAVENAEITLCYQTQQLPLNLGLKNLPFIAFFGYEWHIKSEPKFQTLK